jgi:hypothetical protein
MRNDRVQVAPGQLGAKLRANAYAKFTADRLRAARPVLVVVRKAGTRVIATLVV